MPKEIEPLAPYYKAGILEAGCDEAGRGCLAGPVYAAAVILAPSFKHPLLTDSKKLTAAQRQILRPVIEREALAWAVASASVAEIDEINILNASFLAMHRAIAQLQKKPALLLIDGNRFKAVMGIPHVCLVKGDMRFAAIAAASILAKTYRDDYLADLHEQFPHYAWSSNKGYPTPKHRQAIASFGPCVHHRQSFKLLPDSLS